MAKGPATILVVDDNPATLYSTARVLRGEGFTVLQAGTGQEGLRIAAQSSLDLVVLDVNLPDIDGFEVCRQLRAMPTTGRTPVIHLSATFVNDVDKVQGLDAGADGYITHPVEPPVLVATVNAFLRARRAEDALRESEAKFKAVFEQALNGISLLSHDNIFLDLNPAACVTFGRERDHIVGKHISAFTAHGADALVAGMTAALDAVGAWRGVLPVLHADGRHVELECHVSIHSGPGIRLAVTTDVTERKEIEAERERLLANERVARADAERANRVKDDFLAALSHELRTPLNAIVGWSQLLKPRLAGADRDIVAGIDAIERNARIQAQLIADLLDVSRVASGKLQIDRQWFDPVDAIQSAIDTVAAAARARDIAVEVVVDGPREPLFWDPARF
jgi:PAS domain S-box-containing protein